jgi:hypothetical protein
MLGARMEAGRLLEHGVLADLRGEASYPILERALQKLREARQQMDVLYVQIGKLIEIEKTHQALPEHNLAIGHILRAYPPIERVSLTNSRFANVSAAAGIAINYGPVGSTFPELLDNLQSDLKILQVETDQAIAAFAEILPVARKGGFGSIVLSGRAPLPERIMHSADQTMVYVQFHNRACMAAIAADMQVYPKGLEWIPKPGSLGDGGGK